MGFALSPRLITEREAGASSGIAVGHFEVAFNYIAGLGSLSNNDGDGYKNVT